MIYRVVFYNRSLSATWSTGVYAGSKDQAREIGAILLSRTYNYNIPVEKCEVIDISAITSDELTTT